MIKAVLFDFDGTVADTIPAIREGVNATMRRLDFPEHSYGEIISFINNGARELIRCALPEEYRGNAEFVARTLALYDGCYAEVCAAFPHFAYPGVAELIRELHKTYRIGILSNKQDALLRVLCGKVLFPGTYDAIQGFLNDVPPKPDPTMTERIADSLGVSPAECVMIGDSDVDIRTAANAGMEHIGVSWGYRDEDFLRQHGASRIAHTADEIADFLREIQINF